MKTLIADYTFDASAQTVTFTQETSILLGRVLTVMNVTDGIVLYIPATPAKGGTVGRSAYHAVTCTATFASSAVRERSIGVRLVERVIVGRRAKDPGDTVRFVVEWADWLKQYGTTIASGSWIVADQLGVTTETSVTAANPTSITLSGGGTVRGGKVFTIDNRIVAANGLRDMQSFELSIQNL